MSYPWRAWIPLSAALTILSAAPAYAQTPAAAPARTASRIPRMPDGKPNFNGLWEALGTAYWDIKPHSAHAGPMFQMGAEGAEPAGEGIVEGDMIPYTDAAAAKAKENLAKRASMDPEIKCYMPGIPRANYMSYPFQIVQGNKDIAFDYEYATSNRAVNMGKFREGQVDTWMGTSNGHWEGDTLVIDVSSLNGSSWFDRVGDFQTENTHLVERFNLADADHINYEATIDDKTIYTRPWKISTVLYRRKEKNAQLNEFKCVEFVEELIYGNLRKK